MRVRQLGEYELGAVRLAGTLRAHEQELTDISREQRTQMARFSCAPAYLKASSEAKLFVTDRAEGANVAAIYQVAVESDEIAARLIRLHETRCNGIFLFCVISHAFILLPNKKGHAKSNRIESTWLEPFSWRSLTFIFTPERFKTYLKRKLIHGD